MNKLYDFCNTCYLKNDCRRLTGELDNSKMLADFCFPNKVAKHNLTKANIPLRFQTARPSDYPEGSPLREHVEDAIYRLLNETTGVSLCYLGKVTGTGKTHCAATVANQYLISVMRRRIDNKEDLFQDSPLVYFVDYAWWVDMLRDRYSDSYDDEAIKNAFDVPLLVLDDLGSGKMSDYAREQTNILINHRYSNNLSTIITSNLSLDEMAEPTLLGRRVVSRISDSAEIVEFNLTDRRTRKRTLHIGE
jgi:DNA replication protein DnaC